MPKETNYEHNYVTDAKGNILPEHSGPLKLFKTKTEPSITDKYLELGERMLLALQGIDVSLDELVKHKTKEKNDKQNAALLNGLSEETGSERID